MKTTAILRRSVSAAALLVSVSFGVPSALAANGTAPRASCTSLTGLTLPDAQILSATQNTGYCNVIGVINKRVSSQDPDHFTYGIGFALNLPDTWSGRFEMMGGGGTDGSLNANPQGSAGVELTQGWAVAADDGGHEDSANNAVGGYQDDDANAGGSQHFGVDEQARIDYGYNGIEKTSTISKMIISDYYGQSASFSYLMGCSNGGRDGMVASQKFPDQFDGIVSQNPGFNLPQAGIAEVLERAGPRRACDKYRRQWTTPNSSDLPVSRPGGGLGGNPQRLRRPGRAGRWDHRRFPRLHERQGISVACCLYLRHGYPRKHTTRRNLPHERAGWRAEENLRRTGEFEK